MKRLVAIVYLAAMVGACGGGSPGGTGPGDRWIDPIHESDAGADVDDAAADATDASEDASADAGDDAGVPANTIPTTEGPVQGDRFAGATSFLGIPYARPPVGELRWKAPRPPEPRDGVMSADQFGPACPQLADRTGLQHQDEDCLTLNVWTPTTDPDEPLPVMVWLHGGGFVQGGARQTTDGGRALFEGDDLARNGVVVVTLNYRLGALGFLSHPGFIGEDPEYPAAGNYGLLDQIRALEWLQENIAAFGGDPQNVTLFGQSAGAVSICSLMTTDLADGLFHKAIMQSGYCPRYLRKLDERGVRIEAATDQGERMAEAVGCAEAGDVAACLRSKPAQEIVDALVPPEDSEERPEGFGPILDGYVLDERPYRVVREGRAQNVPLIIGMNTDEGSFYGYQERNMSEEDYAERLAELFPTLDHLVIREYPPEDYFEPWWALAKVWGDAVIVCPSRRVARFHRRAGNDAFTYYFSHVDSVGSQLGLGAYHTVELKYLFNVLSGRDGAEEDAELSEGIQTFWTQFAATGTPGSVGEVQWPLYEASADTGVRLDGDNLGTRSGFRAEQCAFWDDFS